ncbi:MAG TPA: cell division protein FtsQ, partial [Coxiellaceae bacterium]|nr:cell division protein FtsQ [Coxiellaceae bacterium]
NGFFYLNVISMRQQLLKLPWVYEASVQRKWPDTVVVNIIEQKPILQWGKNALVNPEGVVFA